MVKVVSVMFPPAVKSSGAGVPAWSITAYNSIAKQSESKHSEPSQDTSECSIVISTSVRSPTFYTTEIPV